VVEQKKTGIRPSRRQWGSKKKQVYDRVDDSGGAKKKQVYDRVDDSSGVLGEGAFGKVFKVVHRVTDQKRAAKVLRY
jgi:hypothetical protein